MLSAIYFINLRGEIVIFRSFRDDVRYAVPHSPLFLHPFLELVLAFGEALPNRQFNRLNSFRSFPLPGAGRTLTPQSYCRRCIPDAGSCFKRFPRPSSSL
jgi:hypothetical protein